MRRGNAVMVVILVIAAILLIFGSLMPFILLGSFLGGKLDKPTGGGGEGGICAGIQEPYAKIFKDAGSKFGVQPAVIAAIFVAEHRSVKDSDYKNWPNPDGPWATSPKGANGPFQFLLTTWEGYKQDGNGDGKTDVQNLTDAAFGASNYLASIGADGNTSDISRLMNAASRYNSGRAWDKPGKGGLRGQDIGETKRYVEELFIPAFNKFYCSASTNSGDSSGLNIIEKLLTKRRTTSARSTGTPKVIILHYLGDNMSVDESYDYFNNSEKHVQFVIARDGKIYQFTSDDTVAAGAQDYNQPTRDYGPGAISISIENEGNFESNNENSKATPEQVKANIALVRYLQTKYNIKSDPDQTKSAVISHKEADRRNGVTGRRSDPGDKFMKEVLKGLSQ